ncbi:enoyl-CoA hydratase [Craterilacuibacter sinensis]|uniref:Enoyl-CoA hydratase n=1 Tax=Craterilacuibacter sinensis TaxID=2686017 RepID=A0A845BRN0_9NEIS|nr:enoyl-CoA hydratase [Craterilacuibacter sinensis]MXR37884.1 enoyl-CoA hydratase [Craterilacuibacter sinensis]
MQPHYPGLVLEQHGTTLLVVMDNPPANTWTAQSLTALHQLVCDLDSQTVIRALVLTGAGSKFFCAGADLKQFADGSHAAATDLSRLFGRAFEALSGWRGVSIAAINGYAMGGGLEVALACDIRVAAHGAQMALPEAAVGLLPCAGGTQLLPHLVGEGWAKRMILLGERVDAATALRIGLIEEVVAPGDARAAALALAEKVSGASPDSVAACKTLIQRARFNAPALNLPLERELFVGLFDGANQQEGVAAFLQKRTPHWQ